MHSSPPVQRSPRGIELRPETGSPWYHERLLEPPFPRGSLREQSNKLSRCHFWSVRYMPFVGLARVGGVVGVLSGDGS